MKVSEAIKVIEKDGWVLVRQKGSHRQYKHKTKKGLVTISVQKGVAEIERLFGLLQHLQNMV